MANEIKRLFSHVAITSLGSVAHGAVMFLLLPLYSRHLPPDAFGKVDLLMASVMLVGTFAMQGLPSALARRFNFDHANDPAGRRLAASTAWIHVVASTSLVALVCAGTAPWISGVILGDPAHWPLVVAGTAVLVASASVNLCTAVMRGLYRTVGLSAVLLAGAAVNAGVSVWLILGVGKTFEALVLGVAASELTVALLLLLAIRDQLVPRFSGPEIRRMLAFGLPLIFQALSFYLLSTADRYLIRYFMDEASVGLYGMGVRFASILTVALFAPFQKVWNVSLYDIARREDAPVAFGRFTTQFVAVGLLIVAGLALFAELPIRLLLDERYWEAERVVGILGVGLLLFALSDVLKVGLLIESRTHLLPLRVVVAGVCNLLLDIWWIPRFGIHGAASATVVSFLVLAVTTYWMTRSLYVIEFERQRLAWLAASAVPVALVYGLSLPLPLMERHLLRLGAWVALAAALVASGLLDRHAILDATRNLLRRVRGADR